MDYIVYRTLKFIIKPFFMLIHGTKYIGLDNIPKDGPVILAGNHTSSTDALLMLGGPKRIVHMMAKKELFKSSLTRWFFRSMACISVDRSIHDENAKSEAIEVLNNDEVLGIFPEGTVNHTDDILLPFKYGAVSFANKTDSLIVPLVITGKYKLFRRSIKITYGKPFKMSGDLEKDNELLKKKVKDLMIKGESNDKKK